MSNAEWVAALSDPEGLPQLQLRTGIVREVVSSAVPHLVTVEVGEVLFPDVTFLAGHDLEVGAVVQVLKQGPQLFVLGPVAPARMVVAAHNHTSPPVNPASPTPPPPPPAGAAATRTVAVPADASASWAPSFGNWRADGVFQGGTGQRGFWFYGGQVAAVKGAGTIVAATVFVKRSGSGGVSGGANVRLGVHTFGAQPGSGGAALGDVAVVGTLGKGQGATFALTAAQVAALNAGAVGVGLEPGAAGYVTADYLIAEPRAAGDWSGVLSLTVEG